VSKLPDSCAAALSVVEEDADAAAGVVGVDQYGKLVRGDVGHDVSRRQEGDTDGNARPRQVEIIAGKPASGYS